MTAPFWLPDHHTIPTLNIDPPTFHWQLTTAEARLDLLDFQSPANGSQGRVFLGLIQIALSAQNFHGLARAQPGIRTGADPYAATVHPLHGGDERLAAQIHRHLVRQLRNPLTNPFPEFGLRERWRAETHVGFPSVIPLATHRQPVTHDHHTTEPVLHEEIHRQPALLIRDAQSATQPGCG